MSLSLYKKKRDFKSTPEPTGGKTQGGHLIFVIQKHAASSLHYDFRLEMEGVLKSWAVPKGPSVNPADKRLAMLVEDHPYDYKDFEGTIADGNYGAGKVIVWDNGTYEPLEEIEGKKAQEKHLLKQLEEGSLKFRLHGKKLKGEFALVRTQMGKNTWLLIKHRDEYAGKTDITQQNESVISGAVLEDVNKNNRTRAKSPAVEKPADSVKKKPAKTPPEVKKD
jgi:bifunctional non-homologous end joining protein LigD